MKCFPKNKVLDYKVKPSLKTLSQPLILEHHQPHPYYLDHQDLLSCGQLTPSIVNLKVLNLEKPLNSSMDSPPVLGLSGPTTFASTSFSIAFLLIFPLLISISLSVLTLSLPHLNKIKG